MLPLLAQQAAQTWDFDGDRVGELPQGFSNEVGEWKVTLRPEGRGHALRQQARSASAVFNLALIPGTRMQDLELSVELKAEAGQTDQGGGVVWRAQDGKNYYIARYNPLENNFRLYKVVIGTRTQLATADVPGDRNWHTLRINMIGSSIECFLDGRKHLAVTDSTFPGEGRIGVWTKADAQTVFDNLSVKGTRK